jgi:hypothetical protein
VPLRPDASVTYWDFILERRAAEKRNGLRQATQQSGFCDRSKGECLAIIGTKTCPVKPLRLSTRLAVGLSANRTVLGKKISHYEAPPEYGFERISCMVASAFRLVRIKVEVNQGNWETPKAVGQCSQEIFAQKARWAT